MVSVGQERLITISSQKALVQRVASSSAFAKSERLSSFLHYVCDLALSGRADEINEQKIGSAVFGRVTDYDSSIDTIVRTQASRLRQRLEQYFAEEGASEPVCIEIPRGGYVPIFRQRSLTDAPPATAKTAPAQDPKTTSVPTTVARPPIWRSATLAWGIAAILLFALCAEIAMRHRESALNRSPSAARNSFWSLLLQPGRPTMVVVGDSGLVMWEGVTGKSLDLGSYVVGNYRSQGPIVSPSGRVDAINLANSRYTSIVDLELALSISRIAERQGGQIEVRYARDLRADDLKGGNVILIGAPEANPWVELFEPTGNFILRDDRVQHVFSVMNRNPTGQEPKSWESRYTYTRPQPDVFGVVEFLPNLAGTGNVLILEGTSMAGTECAWDFVSDDSTLLPFLDRIKAANGELPHFEMVLGAKNINGSSAKGQILAWRVRD